MDPEHGADGETRNKLWIFFSAVRSSSVHPDMRECCMDVNSGSANNKLKTVW